MKCSCLIDIDLDSGEACEMLSDTTPVAIKEHTCYECKRIIKVGEEYRREEVIFKGKIDTYKTCTDCISLRENFFCGSWYYGMVREEVQIMVDDSYGNVPESCISLLTPNARSWVCDLLEKYWAEKDIDNE